MFLITDMRWSFLTCYLFMCCKFTSEPREHDINHLRSCGNVCWYDFNSNHPIRSQFCTCQDSFTVVSCAKLGPDLIHILHDEIVIFSYLFAKQYSDAELTVLANAYHRNMPTITFALSRDLHRCSSNLLTMHELYNLIPESSWTRFDGRHTASVSLKGYQFPLDI